MDRKKILFIEANRDGTVGGSYYSLLYLIQGLDKTKYIPSVLFCQDNPLIPDFKKVTPHVYIDDFDPSLSPQAKKFIDKIKWPFRLYTEIISKQYHLHKLIKLIQPDLIHFNNGYSSLHEWVLAGRLHNIKMVSHDRGVRPGSSLRTRFFVRYLEAIISVSENYKNIVLKENMKLKRLYMIHNGLSIDAKALAKSLENMPSLLKKYDLSNGSRIIGIVGNIDTWKGQLVVLQAINIVKESIPNIRCLIIGKVAKGAENYKTALDNYIAEHNLQNNIIFTGFQKNVMDHVMALEILVHASIEPEPFGRVLLEGMAAKKPIIATNAGGVPEIIKDGESGVLVPMNDPDELAVAIEMLLKDKNEANRIGDNGHSRLLTEFSTEVVVRNVENVYEDIFNNKNISNY